MLGTLIELTFLKFFVVEKVNFENSWRMISLISMYLQSKNNVDPDQLGSQ